MRKIRTALAIGLRRILRMLLYAPALSRLGEGAKSRAFIVRLILRNLP